MNYFKKSVIFALLSAFSAFTCAELEQLDDEKMSKVKGQAGITIDIIQAKLTIGEIAYKDGGSILVQGVSIGGNSNLTGRTYAHNDKDLSR